MMMNYTSLGAPTAKLPHPKAKRALAIEIKARKRAGL
jgi:hypothetical protein